MVKPTHALNTLWVWDISIRLAHIVLIIGFTTAYLTGESEVWRLIHVYAGGTVLGIVLFRVLWGFVGTPMARFSQFVRSPKLAISYLGHLFSVNPKHYLGHNPAGGWAVLGLLGLSGLTSCAGWFAYQTDAAPMWADVHEVLANTALSLVCLHIIMVFVSNYLHQDGMVPAMFRGYKHVTKTYRASLDPQDVQTAVPAFKWWVQCLGVVCLCSCVAVSVWWVQQ